MSTKNAISFLMEAAQGMYLPVDFESDLHKPSPEQTESSLNPEPPKKKGKKPPEKRSFYCTVFFGHKNSSQNPKQTAFLKYTATASNKKDAKLLACEEMLKLVKNKYGDWREIRNKLKDEKSIEKFGHAVQKRPRPKVKVAASVEAELAPPGYEGNQIVIVPSLSLAVTV